MKKYVVICLASLIAATVSAAETNSKKISLAVVTNLPEESLEAFHTRLNGLNDQIQVAIHPNSLEDVDVIAYLPDLTNRSEAMPKEQYLPLASDNQDYGAVETIVDNLFVEIETGQLIHLVHYSSSTPQHMPLECIARHLAKEAGSAPSHVQKNAVLSGCSR